MKKSTQILIDLSLLHTQLQLKGELEDMRVIKQAIDLITEQSHTIENLSDSCSFWKQEFSDLCVSVGQERHHLMEQANK